MVSYISNLVTRAVNMKNSNLAQDLRKFLDLVDKTPLHIYDMTFNEFVSIKKTLYKQIIYIG